MQHQDSGRESSPSIESIPDEPGPSTHEPLMEYVEPTPAPIRSLETVTEEDEPNTSPYHMPLDLSRKLQNATAQTVAHQTHIASLLHQLNVSEHESFMLKMQLTSARTLVRDCNVTISMQSFDLDVYRTLNAQFEATRESMHNQLLVVHAQLNDTLAKLSEVQNKNVKQKRQITRYQ